MRWPWKREPVKVNGHTVPPGVYGGEGSCREVTLAPEPVPTPSRRESRRCEEWFLGPRIDRGEVERNALACFERTRIPQRVHGHPFGHLCTSSCRVVAGEEIE